MEQPKLPEQTEQASREELQMTIYSLQQQLSDYIGKVTDRDVMNIKLTKENVELKKELEE